MRQYELILILQPDLEDETRSGVIERINTMITESGGEIIKTDIWGTRQLAYEIEDFREGFYVYMEVSLSPASSTEFLQNLRYIEPIIRYMLMKEE
ncbi:MAG: 30S ribosomal protein S6 [Anaerolineaceae bacterium]